MADLKTVIQAMKKTKIITENKKLLMRGSPAQLWGLSMMLNFMNEGAKVIQVRSASRLGQSDLG